MAPPKKNVKMDLTSFLNDESLGGSWDDQVDLNKINLPIENVTVSNTIPLEHFKNTTFGSGGGRNLDKALSSYKKERVEYPVPDRPPYRARINNLPWDISEDGIKDWTEDGLEKPGCVTDLAAPRDQENNRLKGWAFITFREREDLVNALKMNGSRLNDRTVYVAVAAPRDGFDDGNWSGARGSQFQASGSGEDGPDLDWGLARGSNFREQKPRRETFDPDWNGAKGAAFEAHKNKKEEFEPDWGTIRGSKFVPSEAKKPREEFEPDWSAGKGSKFVPTTARKPREEQDLDWRSGKGSNYSASEARERKPKSEEPELSWGTGKGSNFQSNRHREPRPAKEHSAPKDDLDWGAVRQRQAVAATSATASASTTGPYKKQEQASKQPEAPKIQRSLYDVLQVEDDDDEEEEEQVPEKKSGETADTDVAALANATAALNVDDGDAWEVVGKK